MRHMRGKSGQISLSLIAAAAIALIALGGYYSSHSSPAREPTSGDLASASSAGTRGFASSVVAPASFTGGCVGPSGSSGLTAGQLGSYEYILTGLQGSVEAVPNSQLPGRCAISVTVRQGDFTRTSAKTNRTEFAAPHTLWYSGESVWYALSFELAPGSPLPRAGGWMLVDQFFAQNIPAGISGGSPPLSFEITSNGQIRMHVRGGAKSRGAESAPRNNSYFISPVRRGVWHDLLIHVRWSTTDSGLVGVWQRASNGAFTTAPLVSVGGPNVLTVSGSVLPVYAETGIYRSASPQDQTVDYGGLWARADRAEAEAFFSENPA
jgi:hypothetical protein